MSNPCPRAIALHATKSCRSSLFGFTGIDVARSVDAIAAASQAQAALATEVWPQGAPVRLRIGVHAGEAIESHTDDVAASMSTASTTLRYTLLNGAGREWRANATSFQLARTAFITEPDPTAAIACTHSSSG
jgi:hypothetical protein